MLVMRGHQYSRGRGVFPEPNGPPLAMPHVQEKRPRAGERLGLRGRQLFYSGDPLRPALQRD